MIVAFDPNGYAYDVDTGYLVNLTYDDAGNAYDAETGEQIERVILDSSGSTVYVGSGGVDWNGVINTAAQAYAAGQGAAQSGHYIPVQTSQPPYGYQTITGSGGASVSGGISPGGVSGGLKLSTNTIILIAAGALLFVLGQRKGR